MSKPESLVIGQMVGAWEIIATPEKGNMEYRYLCRCICGCERWVTAVTLRNGSSKSCGCQRFTKRSRTNHFENMPTSKRVIDLLNLIQLGYLPPADQLSVEDGSPSWTLESIAMILGIGYEDMVRILERSSAGLKCSKPERTNSLVLC